MIPGVNIREKASAASINRAGGSGDFRGQRKLWAPLPPKLFSPLRKILGSKEYQDWLEILKIKKYVKNYARYTALRFKNLCILPENSAEGLVSRREHCWVYVSICENTPKRLPHLPP